MNKAVKPTRWRGLRVILRLTLAVTIALALLVWWTANSGRGFLPQQRRHLFIEARPQPDGQWTFSKTGSGAEDAPDPPLPTDPAVVHIRMQEESMGRTGMGEWSSWRGSHWLVVRIMRNDGATWDFSDQVNPRDANLTDALSDFVIDTIIPQSEALAIWPDVPPEFIQRNGSDLWWSARQRKASALKFGATVAICILIGVTVSCVVFPVRRLTAA